MNYICTDCGHIFEEGEEIIKHFDGEDWACCPSCGSTEIVDGVRCKDCGGVFVEDELFWGRCEECLLEKMADYDLFFEYLTEGDYLANGDVQTDSVGGLEEFVFVALWRLDEKDVPHHSSFELKRACSQAYFDMVKYDRDWCEKELYNTIKDWMTDLDLCDFAEWLNERERKKATT